MLIENPSGRGSGIPGALNHIGVEVVSSEAVDEASRRLVEEGLETKEEHDTTCCYVRQDKVWVVDPDGAPWEIYTVLADAPPEAGSCGTTSMCCELQQQVAPQSTTPC